MSDEFAHLSELELLSLIGRAEQELDLRKTASKDKLKQEIEDRHKSTGLELGELFTGAAGLSAGSPGWLA